MFTMEEKEKKIVFESNAVCDWIERAINLINAGMVNRLDHPEENVIVYKCGSIIRIGIKEGKK